MNTLLLYEYPDLVKSQQQNLFFSCIITYKKDIFIPDMPPCSRVGIKMPCKLQTCSVMYSTESTFNP